MKLPIFIIPEAEDDLQLAIAWHESVRAGLGAGFERRFEESLSHIQSFPLAYRAVYKDARRILLRQFKYHVYYVVRSERIYIAAVIHASRHPKVWKKRLRESV